MWWGGYSLMLQLARLIPKPKPRAVRTGTPRPPGPVDGFGCCPACHEFVQVKPWGPSGIAVCPSCGHRVRSLDPLGSEKPSVERGEL